MKTRYFAYAFAGLCWLILGCTKQQPHVGVLGGVTGCFLIAVALTRSWKLILKKNEEINILLQTTEEDKKEIALLRSKIANEQETIKRLKQERENIANKEKTENLRLKAAINNKIRKREEYIGGMLDEIRRSYTYALNAYFRIFEQYEQFKIGLDKKAYGKIIEKFNQFFYGKGETIGWETVSKLIPERLTEAIKREYPGLDDTGVRICCLALFKIDKNRIIKILHLKIDSWYSKKSAIKRITGIKTEDMPQYFKDFLGK